LKVSLILCSKNGGDRLAKCLAAFSKLKSVENLELVLVDNGSTDEVSIEMMRQFCATSDISSSTTSIEKPGNSAGRNAGIAIATGDILLFVDDDCYVDKEFVDEWRAVFLSKQIGFGSGKIMRVENTETLLGCNESDTPVTTQAGEFFARGLIQGSNMGFRRQCLMDVGCFDDRFGAGTPFAGEEWDAALRASYAGWGGGYFPGPTVTHDHGRSGTVAMERLFYYDYGAGAVYAKHMVEIARIPTIFYFAKELYRLRKDILRLRNLWRGCRAFVSFTREAK
jgi:glycosyltransferase involved in cell wall biosynthesis